ncbi:MAG: hypothetical protein ABEI74_02010 [Candidatus Pacearchaeota archaeon]
MDTIAHFLWGSGLGKISRDKFKKNFSWVWTGLWAVFPDLLAFGIAIAYAVLFLGQIHGPHFITDVLYPISHSFLVFGVVFLAVFAVKRRFYLAMLGWPLHILFDIFTHTSDFYPTPFLWPLVETSLDGVKWSNPVFMVLNYVVLIGLLVYAFWDELKKMFGKIQERLDMYETPDEIGKRSI